MNDHEYVRKNAEEELDQNWEQQVKIFGSHFQFKGHFIKMLSDVDSMWDGQIGGVTIAKHRMELPSRDAETTHPAPYQAGPKAHEFEKHDVDQILLTGAIEPAQTEVAAPVVFSHKKNGSLRFSFGYLNLNPVAKQEVFPIQLMKKLIDSFGGAKVLSTLNATDG